MRSETPFVSVVIPARNGAATLGIQLEALSRQTYTGPWEVVLADNGSTDETGAVAESWASSLPRLRVADASRAAGVNVARNEGARAAEGALLLFCDADDLVCDDWITCMVLGARHFDILGGPVHGDALNDEETRRAVGDTPPADALPEKWDRPYAMGCNVGIWADVLRDVGGWNEDYVGGGDEIDLSWRVLDHGYCIGFAPGAVVQYRYRVGTRDRARQVYRWGMAETLLFRDHPAAAAAVRTPRSRIIFWVRLVTPLLRWPLLSKEDRASAVRQWVHTAGQLRGNLRYRVLYV
jgi:glycosyltransferase involved in cell wall biosynthesis